MCYLSIHGSEMFFFLDEGDRMFVPPHHFRLPTVYFMVR